MGFGAKIAAGFRKKITAVRNDANFSRVGRGPKAGARIVRAGAGHYFLNKVPIYTWVSSYMPTWLIGDVVAGASVGLIMFPQAVMFSALAGLPVQVFVTASWLPSIISAVMGTSRDMSVGPLFMPSVTVGGMIAAMKDTGLPPTLIAATLSLCVGLWSLLVGLLNLGFLFDSLSVPIVLGFTCGMAIVSYMGQFAPLFGLVGVSPMLSQLTSQFIAKLPQTNPAAFGLGAGSIVLLVVLQKIEKKWGGKSEAVKIVMGNRNILILLLTTGISYYVNMGRKEQLWLSVGDVKTDVQVVEGLSFEGVKGLFMASFTLFFGIAIEHVIVAKALARTRGYAIDPSQELVHLGISNIANSFMGGAPVGGGDMARASVNATSGVKSPLSGLFVAAVVGAGMTELSGFVAMIPLPAIAAVIIVAVIDVMPSPGEMSKYWKWSFTDWATFLITFNTTLVVTPDMGLEIGGGILAVYTLFRLISSRPKTISSTDLENQYASAPSPPSWGLSEVIPPGVAVMRLENDLMCANAERVKRRIVETAMTMHSAIPFSRQEYYRAWNDCRDKRVQYLRYRAGVKEDDRMLPRLHILVLDMSAVSFIDSSGLHAIEDIKSQLREYGGPRVQFRFVGLTDAVQRRFKRAAWKFVSPYGESQETTTTDETETSEDYVFDHLPDAIHWQTQRDGNTWALGPLEWEIDGKDNASVTSAEHWPGAVPRDMIF